MSRIDRRDIIEAVTTGAVAFAWYALPDAVRSPRARAGIKVALMAPTVAIGTAQTKRATEAAVAGIEADASTAADPGTGAEPGSDIGAETEADGAYEPPDGRSRARLVRQGALSAAGVLLLAGTVVGVVAAERGIYRLGERLAARGTQWPHTRIGLVAGLASGGLSIATAPLSPPTPGPDRALQGR